ncbi:MAG: hypothetical protein COA36_08455 [Desulfotalea sp.]|nr:MAG: hypothetical protein COA36_08455 [Desulfotalea sp.]
MSSEPRETTEESPGDLLRNARISKGFDLAQMADNTKISIKNLTAMEENNYDSLPAEVFRRGFYTLYANQLSLDPSIILGKYDDEKALTTTPDSDLQPCSNSSKDYRDMAQRPNSFPSSCIGLATLLLLFFGAFLSWYFSWNPATYLSQKIQNLQETTQIEAPLKSPEKEFFELQNMLSIPTLSNASEIEQQFTPAVVATGKYIIIAQFKETTKVTLAIDDRPVFDSVYKKGDSVTWSANEKINITLPGKTATALSLNKTPILLPQTENATLTISIPNDLQQ